jgi:hypothetical protein
MGSLGKFIVVKGRFARDFINSNRTATAQNVAVMNLNGALNINGDDFHRVCAPDWWDFPPESHAFGEAEKWIAGKPAPTEMSLPVGRKEGKKNGARRLRSVQAAT